MKCFWGIKNVCSISSLYSEVLDGGGKAIVAVIVSSVATTFDVVIAPYETGVWGFEISNTRQKIIQG